MSSSQAESVIRRIIREIAQTCRSRGESLSETLIAFMVKAAVLDPRNQFNVERTLTKQDVQKLIELCVDRLTDHSSPTIQTIKMQVYFDMNYTSRREFVEMQQKLQESRLQPLSREITDSRAKSRDELMELYSRIIRYSIQSRGDTTDTDISTVRESTAALQSVFPQSQLGSFMSLPKREKEQQLRELSLLVSGIRLFNKDMGRGGEAIPNLPDVLSESLLSVVSELERELAGCEQLSLHYTALLEKSSARDEGPVQPLRLQQALYNSRQLQIFLRLTLADVILCAKEVTRLQSDLMSHMTLLRDAVHNRTTVPTTHVFPHFKAVAQVWAELEREMRLLSALTSVGSGVRGFLSAPVLSPDQMEPQERTDTTTEERVVASEMSWCEWCFPESFADFQDVPLQYNGFCGSALVKKDGLLLPGHPSIGVLKHRERYYAFSSRSAAYEFASAADEMCTAVLDLARRRPELIQLLQLQHEFASVTPYSEMQSGQKLLVKAVLKSDAGVQTETHPLDTHIVRAYEWSEWELRRKAIRLANLQSKVTRSVQSDLSHMRRHGSTQTLQRRDAGSQTRRDTGSRVPRPQVYVSGLRGGTSALTVDLTRDDDL